MHQGLNLNLTSRYIYTQRRPRHILCRYSLLQAMLQSPPGPFWPHQYLLFTFKKEITQIVTRNTPEERFSDICDL